MKYTIQAYLGDIAGSVPNHKNKANTEIDLSELFGFPVHVEVMFKLYSIFY